MIENNYFINQNLMFMEGFYDKSAKGSTLVTETERAIMVGKSPVEILDFSIELVGFNFKGAMKTSRLLHPNQNMCPIMVNQIRNIVLFPIHSAKKVETIWFNPAHIRHTYASKSMKGKTTVEFNNGHVITVDCKLSAFNDKLQRAEQYRNAIINAAKNPQSFIFHSKNKNLLILLLAYKILVESGLLDWFF